MKSVLYSLSIGTHVDDSAMNHATKLSRLHQCTGEKFSQLCYLMTFFLLANTSPTALLPVQNTSDKKPNTESMVVQQPMFPGEHTFRLKEFVASNLCPLLKFVTCM